MTCARRPRFVATVPVRDYERVGQPHSPWPKASISATRWCSCGCRKSKLPDEAPARKLYVSAWFLKVRDLVEASGARWYILLGLLRAAMAPDEVIAPYDHTLNRLGVAKQRAWAFKVLSRLLPSWPDSGAWSCTRAAVPRVPDRTAAAARRVCRGADGGPPARRAARVAIPAPISRLDDLNNSMTSWRSWSVVSAVSGRWRRSASSGTGRDAGSTSSSSRVRCGEKRGPGRASCGSARTLWGAARVRRSSSGSVSTAAPRRAAAIIAAAGWLQVAGRASAAGKRRHARVSVVGRKGDLDQGSRAARHGPPRGARSPRSPSSRR